MSMAALGSVAALGLASAPAAAEDVVLKVYTAIEEEQMPPYKEAFEAANPGIKIEWQRDSTGVVTARLLAEKENRQADVVWGLAASSLMVLDQEGMLESYKPVGFDQIKDDFKDRRTGWPTWVGMDAWASAICFNTAEAEKLGLPKPTSWKDLLDPVYQGHIVMPNPGSSGTGFLSVAAWLQMFGETGGWQFMDGLHANMNTYTHSGSKPCKAAGAGEYPIGISFSYPGVKLINDGAPLEVILPTEGIGWEMEATAIMKGTDKLEAAQKLADFAASAEANKLYNQSYQVLARKDVTPELPENYPANEADLLLSPNNFEWAAGNRQAILDEWQKRYGAKSEPKS
ncbi:MAG: putative 2-aminoethylphosphonate ABC transporter substrate-binding protein [Rhodospirillaceae bacterium]|nr:putative 2-aminoethylphosphonate ABC transporter substrate-binding protein [Rhodospirillaceae bacterium]